jgi:hypothetical protein
MAAVMLLLGVRALGAGPREASYRVRVYDHGNGISVGSGTAISETTILTCGHLFREGCSAVRVSYPKSGHVWAARVKAYSIDNPDLAILEVEGKLPDHVPLAQEEAPPGEELTLIGYGTGDVMLEGRGEVLANRYTRPIQTTSCSVIDGVSGGGTFTSDGRLAGVIWGTDPSPQYGSHAEKLGTVKRWMTAQGYEVNRFCQPCPPRGVPVCPPGSTVIQGGSTVRGPLGVPWGRSGSTTVIQPRQSPGTTRPTTPSPGKYYDHGKLEGKLAELDAQNAELAAKLDQVLEGLGKVSSYPGDCIGCDVLEALGKHDEDVQTRLAQLEQSILQAGTASATNATILNELKQQLAARGNQTPEELVGDLKQFIAEQMAQHHTQPQQPDPRTTPLGIYLTARGLDIQDLAQTDAAVDEKIEDGHNIRVVVLSPRELSVADIPRLVLFPGGKVIRGGSNIRMHLANLVR